MAQLKDLIVNGVSNFIGAVNTTNLQITTLKAPSTSGGTTYGPGTNGQVLLSNGTSTYWGSAAPTVTESTVSGWGFTKNTGTVTSVQIQATSPVVSSNSASSSTSLSTTISLANNYGDTKNPYASKTKNYVLAAPSTANGVPTFRALVAADIPDLSGTYSTTDNKVLQNAAITTNGNYPIILGYSTATTSVINVVNKSSTLTYNPSSKQMKIGTSIIGETGFSFNSGPVSYGANGLDGDPCFIDFNSDYLKLRFEDSETNSIELGNNGLIINDGTGVGTDGQILTSNGTNAYWNSLNVKNGTGNYSLILNNLENNEASGNYSIAGGRYNISSGSYSVTLGSVNKNSGVWSITTGQANIISASANGSFTIGNGNLTEGAYSVNIGNGINLGTFKLTGAANATTYTYNSLPSKYTSYTSTFPCIVFNSTDKKVAKIVSIDTTNNTIVLDSTISETAISALSCYIVAAQTISNNRTLLVGAGLRTATTDQLIVGQCNVLDANAALIVANGSTTAGNNVFTVSKTGDIIANSIKISKIQAPTSAGGATYGTGTDGQALLTDGSNIYWGTVSSTLKFNNISVSSWVSDTTSVPGFSFKGTATCTGVTSDYIPNVIFDYNELISGNYAPYADSDTNKVYIYSTTNTTVTVPTIYCV